MNICPQCGSLVGERSTESLESARLLILEVAEQHMLTVEELIDGGRQKPLVEARRCAIRRLRSETSLPLKAIGHLLGGLDHSTVSHHLSKNGMGARAAATSRQAKG